MQSHVHDVVLNKPYWQPVPLDGMSHMNDAATTIADAAVTTKRSGFMDSPAACNEQKTVAEVLKHRFILKKKNDHRAKQKAQKDCIAKNE